MAAISLPRISLQALEAFEYVAQSGSIQNAASEMGLAISSVSHHIARLEEQLGVTLFDRSTRPFALTREGKQALHHLSEGLFHLRQATSETIVSGLLGVRSLNIGIIEDFESSVTPELAVILARQMPRAKLSIRTVLSHEASGLLQKGEIDVAMTTSGAEHLHNAANIPILRDPYMLAMPKGLDAEPADLVQGKTDLPFLRFNARHMIGQQIAAHLARNRITLADRFAFDSAQSIMAVVAGGDGWSLITPLGFMRAQRYADLVRLHPLPIPAFARSISISTRADFDGATRRAIVGLFQQIVQRGAVDPACRMYPWLTGDFALCSADASQAHSKISFE